MSDVATRDQLEAQQPPVYAPTSEVRFAVVMYGGVSLAIYINGVTQELLQLVRATAPATAADATQARYSDAELEDTTAAIYREAGRRMSYGRPVDEAAPGDDLPIRTRFVVDIISGTSAGGINGVYLAKALANDQPIDSLKNLWITEGDIGKLVDDGASYGDLDGLRRQRPPRAVLNGRRMYWKLLEALDSMDARPRADDWESPLVDELDLWITTTDLRGLTVPLDLYDRLVFELRHRMVFRFLYRGRLAPHHAPENQFGLNCNPMLAFAARCTSAFPFAFEPVQLPDVDEVLRAERFSARYGQFTSGHPCWQTLFPDYIQDGDGSAASGATYATQSFADGGYLDNKPFSWTTDALELRTAERPVDRRLIYIEPDPESPRATPHTPGLEADAPAWGPLSHLDAELAKLRPDAIENARSALSGIPRYEPIREDLERLLKRNREVDRLQEITRAINLADDELRALDVDKWRTESIETTRHGRGVHYVAYQRLRVATTGDDVAALMTHLAGHDEHSDSYSAIRCLTQAWIDRHFPREGTEERSQCEFLLRYDFGYRIRRIDFLQRNADEEIKRAGEGPIAGLLAFKGALSRNLATLRAAGRAIRERAADANDIAGAVAALRVTSRDVVAILSGVTSKAESEQRAGALLDSDPDRHDRLTAVMEALRASLEDPFADTREQLETAIADLPVAPAHDRLKSAYDLYELYDSLHYPIAYRSVGEADRVEVVRISPLDAPSIISDPIAQRRKLAGRSLHHFGGFFDASWRRNDILWGRLDAAERILTCLLGATPLRDRLLRRAQLAIIKDEVISGSREELVEGVTQTLLADSSVADRAERARQALEAAATPEEVLEGLCASGQIQHRSLEPESTLRTGGRMVTVTGAVLEAIAEAPAAKRAARVTARIGRFLIGFLELTTTRSVVGVIGRRWVQLLLITAALMIVGGALVGLPEAASAGWILALAVVAVRVATWATGAYLGGGGVLARLSRILIAGSVALAVICVAWAALSVGRAASDAFNDWACELPDPLPRITQDAWPLGDSDCAAES